MEAIFRQSAWYVILIWALKFKFFILSILSIFEKLKGVLKPGWKILVDPRAN